jgi:hypothetical protein
MLQLRLRRKVISQKREQRRAEMYRAILHYEGRLGGQIFGPVQKGGRREFFCLDEHTWVWHEEWLDERKQRHAITTRYDIRPNGVLKSQGGQSYQMLSPEESRNLYQAIRMYVERVTSELQRLSAHTA